MKAISAKTLLVKLKKQKSFFIYSLGEYLKFVTPIILLPIFTRVLTESDYGILNTFTATMNIFSLFVSFSAVGAVNRAYMDREKIDFSLYLGNALIVNTLIFLCIYIPILIITNFNFLPIPNYLLFMLPIYILLHSFIAYKSKLWIIQERPLKNTIFDSSYRFISLVLSLVLVIFITEDWTGRVFGILIADIVFCLISLFFLKKEDNFRLKFNKKYAIDILKYGFPLIFHGIGLSILDTADKLILSSKLGLEEMGIYGVAFSISSVLLAFIHPFDKTITPKIFKYLKSFNNENAYKIFKLFIFNIIYLVVISISIIVFMHFFGKFFLGNNFITALKYLPILLLGHIFYGIYRFYVMQIFFSKKTYLVSISSLSSGLISILILFYLIPKYGVFGAAWGYTISKAIVSFLVMSFAAHLYPIRISK